MCIISYHKQKLGKVQATTNVLYSSKLTWQLFWNDCSRLLGPLWQSRVCRWVDSWRLPAPAYGSPSGLTTINLLSSCWTILSNYSNETKAYRNNATKHPGRLALISRKNFMTPILVFRGLFNHVQFPSPLLFPFQLNLSSHCPFLPPHPPIVR